MVVELRMYYCGELFRIHLRRFYGVYLCSKSVHSISKILKDFPFWRDTFEHRFLKNYFMTTKKCNKKLLVVYEQIEKIKVSVMFHCSQTFSEISPKFY